MVCSIFLLEKIIKDLPGLIAAKGEARLIWDFVFIWRI